MSDRIIIIGGGIIGLLSGRELLRRGHAVTLLDAGDLRGSASTGNAGIISPGHPPIPTPDVAAKAFRMLLDRRSPLYIPPRPSLSLLRWLLAFRRACRPDHFQLASTVLDRFSKHSRDLFEPLVAEAPGALDASGFAEIVRTEAGREHLRHEHDRLEQFGFNVELQDGDQLRERDPGWDPGILAVLVHHEGIIARPDDLLLHLADRFAAEGGTLRTQARVSRVEHRGDRVESVRLDSGEPVEGDAVLVAAGIWSSTLVRNLGLRVPMQAAKGYHVMMEMEQPPTTAALLSEACVVVNPMGTMVRLAGTLELSGINSRMVRRRLDMLPQAAKSYLPGMAQASPRSEWNGLRPCTADGLPVIGPVPGLANAYLATGHGMMGVTLGPGTAELVADCIDGQSLPEWARPMTVARFS